MTKPFKASAFVSRFLWERKGLTLLLAFSVLGAALAGLLPAYALRYLIDGILTPSLQSGTLPSSGILIGASFAYFGSYLLLGLFEVGESYLVDLFGQKLIHALRKAMMAKAHRIRSAFYSGHGSGEMTSRVTDDVTAIELLFADGLVQMVVSLVLSLIHI